MALKNRCASVEVPLGVIQSRSAYSRSNAGWRPSFARSLIATPPRSLRGRPSRPASSAIRRASSTTSGRIWLVLPPLLFMPSRPLSHQAPSLDPPRRPRRMPPYIRQISCPYAFFAASCPGLDDVAVTFEPRLNALIGISGLVRVGRSQCSDHQEEREDQSVFYEPSRAHSSPVREDLREVPASPRGENRPCSGIWAYCAFFAAFTQGFTTSRLLLSQFRTPFSSLPAPALFISSSIWLI